MFDPLTIGMLAADALNLGLNGYNVYKNHSNAKAIEALKGAERPNSTKERDKRCLFQSGFPSY